MNGFITKNMELEFGSRPKETYTWVSGCMAKSKAMGYISLAMVKNMKDILFAF